MLTLWRANLLGSSSKGNEYFLKHLLGTHSAVRATETPPDRRPRDVTWRAEAPEGKLDLLVALDFRMTSSTLLADLVLPAATWYEKHDLSSTDMHPFVHAFTPAIDPPWETRTDFAAFTDLARRFSELAATTSGSAGPGRRPLQHDTPGEVAQPGGRYGTGRRRGRAGPGRTMPGLSIVERDYAAVADKLVALGPLVERLGLTTKAVTVVPDREVDQLAHSNGVLPAGPAAGRPALDTDAKMAEAILALSGTTNGRLAVGGLPPAGGAHRPAAGRPRRGQRGEADHVRRHAGPTGAGPHQPGVVRPETGGRRYAPFTINVERLKPWHTLTGRMHLFLDHAWMSEFGETMPTYRPPLDMALLFGEPALGPDGGRQVTVRYLTPHSKWSIHSEYQDNLLMLSLSRGGPTLWMSPGTRPPSGSATTSGSRRSTATACWWPGRSSRTGCRTGWSSSTTPRSGW